MGGTGLISSAITSQLVEREHEVTVYHRGTSDGATQSVRTVRGDRNDVDQLSAVIRSSPWDSIIDMVCYTAEQARQLTLACRHCIPHVVFCSTVEVYSRRVATNLVTEEYERRPSNEYGIGKRDAEDLLSSASAEGAFDLTILRPAYTYGRGAPMISSFGSETYVGRLRAGRPVLVAGDGSFVFTVCHRDDVARAFVSVVEREVARGKIYNVTGTERMTWDDYYNSLGVATGSLEPKLVHIPVAVLTAAAPLTFGRRSHIFSSHYAFDSTLAAAELGFGSEVAWSAGLADTLVWLEGRQTRGAAEHLEALEELIIQSWESHIDDLVAEVVPHDSALVTA